jgi:hypothetical protein
MSEKYILHDLNIVSMSVSDTLPFLFGFFAAIGGVIGGSLSTMVNHFVTMKQNKAKNKQVLLEQKLQIYSYFIYHLDSLRQYGNAMQEKSEKGEKPVWLYKDGTLKSTFKAIDDEIQYKLHLLDYEIFKEWVYVKARFVDPVSESHLKRLTILLIEQYNQIINEYSKVVGKGLQKIPSDLLLQNTDKDNI